MKTKFLFASLVASAVMVGCSNEELADVQNAASNDELALIFDGFEGVESRMAYDGTNGSFLWEIGDQIGVSRVAGKGVTTNYLFDAELVSDDNTKPITDAAWRDKDDADKDGKYAYFTTAFGSIFKGDYVVYYPYNPDFCEDGKIVAKLNIGQTEVASSKTEHVANDGFMMSKAVAFEGGQKAEKFALYPVFGRLVFNIKTADNCDIETIVLRSLNGKTLPTEMEIDADINVVDGKLNPAYMHVVESSKVEEIVMSVDGNATANASTGYTAYFTLIPGTYTNFAIDVVTNKGTFTKTFTSATISTGNRANVNLSFAAGDMVLKRTYYATSAESWKTAVDKIAQSQGATNAEAAPATIKVMNNIVLNSTSTFRPDNAIHALVPVTVEGVGSIEIPSGALGNGALTNVTFNIPVEAETITSVGGESVKFAKGLKTGALNISHANVNYTVEGGKIGTTTILSVNSSTLTANNVTFTGAVTSSQTAGLDDYNVAKVNFNNCTFETGLTNTAGAIRLTNASIVRPNTWSNYSELSVTGGNVYLNEDVTINNFASTAGRTILDAGADVEIDNYLPAIAGNIDVKKDAVLTLGANISYVLDGKIAVDGKLINNGQLTATAAGVIQDVDDNNANVGVLENNNIVRVTKVAYDKNAWYTNQNIKFENKAHYNYVLKDVANWATYVNKSDITGIEVKDVAEITPKGKGLNGSVIDFSGLNLVLNPQQNNIVVNITDGLKFKNITVQYSKDDYSVTFNGASKDAVVTTGDLNVNGELVIIDDNNDDRTKVKVTNVAVGSKGILDGGAQVTYTGTFTNKGTVAGGNPVK